MSGASVKLTVLDLLEKYPATRSSLNVLIFTYWTKIDKFGSTETDFNKTTPAESIVREARDIWRTRPDLSPTANPVTPSNGERRFLQMQINELFPQTEVAHDLAGSPSPR